MASLYQSVAATAKGIGKDPKGFLQRAGTEGLYNPANGKLGHPSDLLEPTGITRGVLMGTGPWIPQENPPAPPPDVPPPTPMPTLEQANESAKRKARQVSASNRGRAATVLTGGETLGA